MLSGNSETRQIAARVHELLSDRQAWNRRAWSIGSALGLRELLEAVDARADGILSEEAVNYLANTLCAQTGPDPGIGPASQRALLQKSLRARPLRPHSLASRTTHHILADTEAGYLKRWADAAARPEPGISTERFARSVATHLLDAGFSSEFLSGWWGVYLSRKTAHITLPELLESAHRLVGQPEATFDALVAFDSLARDVGAPSVGWVTAKQAIEWLRERGHATAGLRLHGGVVLTISARDHWAAAEKTRQYIDQLSSRAAVGSSDALHVTERFWIDGASRAFSKARPRRGVDVHSLEREGVMFQSFTHDKTESAIELLGMLDGGPPGAAVASGWAAIEALLLGRGEGVPRVVAADRLAEIVACSFPRAELTTLGYRHAPSKPDVLASALQSASSNRERSTLVAKHLLAGGRLTLTSLVDSVAEERLRRILHHPFQALTEVRGYLQQAARRLYRQRNLVMHAGRLRSTALSACLRTTAPLVGAAVDRICHAVFTENTEALDLVARARRRLALLKDGPANQVTELLEP